MGMNLNLALMRIPKVGRMYTHLIVQLEGGERLSKTLRQFSFKNMNVNVGLHSYGGCFALDFNNGGVQIDVGRYCSIARNVHYFGAAHPMDYVSMSAYWYETSFGFKVRDVDRASLVIGNDVWIGYGVTITRGCKKIGNGSVIGAGSIVTKDVKAYSINVGVPSRAIAMRFPDNVVRMIDSSEWWSREPEELYTYYRYMHNPEEFVRMLEHKSSSLRILPSR